MHRRIRTHVIAVAAFCALALAFSWALPLHLATHLTGPPDGDAGVYVWNQWVFRHELIDHRSFPYVTDTLFGPHSTVNLSLHNFTTAQNLVALPLIPILGVVATFNVVYMLTTVMTAYVTFLLARRLTGAIVEAWLAGALFAWSPILTTRGGAHFSLVAAAPLALFVLVALRVRERYRARDAIGLGAAMWWAASTDVYYAVYCLLIALGLVAVQLVTIEPKTNEVESNGVSTALDVVLICLAGMTLALAISGGWATMFMGRELRLRSLYTPMLAMTLFGMVRIFLHYHMALRAITSRQASDFGRFAFAAVLFAVVLLSPVLYAVGVRIVDGDFDTPRIHWRSSPPGIDAVALILPNPNHPLAPRVFAEWLASRTNGYLENVASLPWIALATIVVAFIWGWSPPRRWVAFTIAFALLALGPFIHVAGINTYVPGPWAVLRYLPVIGLARTPTRFAVVVALGVAMLFAFALDWLTQRHAKYRRHILTAVTLVMTFELLPAPRVLYSAAIPGIYKRVAAAPSDAALLELPFGIRDGTSSVGNFTARTQFYQTSHGKIVMGGYLSRLAKRRVLELRQNPVLNALALLSENKLLSPDQETAFLKGAATLLVERNIRFVVVDRNRASPALLSLSIRAFDLELVESEGSLGLYRRNPQ